LWPWLLFIVVVAAAAVVALLSLLIGVVVVVVPWTTSSLGRASVVFAGADVLAATNVSHDFQPQPNAR
jgi:hypothetical protein